MTIKPGLNNIWKAGASAFSLIEVLVGVAIMGVMFVSLYAGMSSGFAVTQLARENLRATQIMLERMEGIRLFNWDQVNYSNMIPSTFVAHYYPLASGTESKGIEYHGTMQTTNAALYGGASYENSMRKIVVSVRWTNNAVARSRSMTSYVSKFGIQNYVYNN
jgi:prepilin-type N-terminal cleavage/methylation domain-containing protein